ncbi:LCP family protein [Oculatella sp. LEGE 06141]|nr:LCP family protein [Oculatella sp. LEGE 06141]MBE9182368.1 LCP family protein [Oculatella sp. LEGE 06141]
MDESSDAASPSQKLTAVQAIGWGVAFAITAAVSATLGTLFSLTVPLPAAIAPQASGQAFSISDLWQKGFRYQITRPVTVLVMGIDRVPDVPVDAPEVLEGRSDTMLLVRIDPGSNSVNVLSVPRDTQISIPGVGLTKVNHANALGGPELAAQVLSHNLNGITIDRYVRVSTDAFRELVDLLGGVEIYVPHRMAYTDQTQQLEIDLDEGWQTLNGDQAEQFARFRNDAYGDVGRVQRQQQLIRALREKIATPAVIPKLPQAIQLIQSYVDTNLSLDEMLALVNFGMNLDREQFRMVMLPGRFSTPDEYIASYWLMDTEGMDKVMHDYFQVGAVNFVDQTRDVYDLRIAVQNASGEAQQGREMANYLHDQGFNNVYLVRDWSDEQQETQIIVQWGDLNAADLLHSKLGVGEVVSASTGDLDSDLTIRIGTDWTDLVPAQSFSSGGSQLR